MQRTIVITDGPSRKEFFKGWRGEMRFHYLGSGGMEMTMLGSVAHVTDAGYPRDMEFEFTPQYEAHPYQVRYNPDARGNNKGQMTRWQK